MSDLNLQQLDPFETQLKELVTQTQGNTFADALNGDKLALERVKRSRLLLRDVRVAVTKKGKDLREDATDFSRRVIAREKELVAMITPEEDRLQAIEDEAKKKAERLEQEAKYPARLARLEELNKMPHAVPLTFDEATKERIIVMDDVTFETHYNHRFALNNESARQENMRIEEERKLNRTNTRKTELLNLGFLADSDDKRYFFQTTTITFNEVENMEDVDWNNLLPAFKLMISKAKMEASEVTEKLPENTAVAGEELLENDLVVLENGIAKKAQAEVNDIPEQEDQTLDKGHIELGADIRMLKDEFDNYEFHDFRNNKYPFPKIALTVRLKDIIKKNELGAYDN